MIEFSNKWHNLFMKNMVTEESLQRLVNANKLIQSDVEKWKAERLEGYGY